MARHLQLYNLNLGKGDDEMAVEAHRYMNYALTRHDPQPPRADLVTIQATQVIEGINLAVTRTQRLTALKNAMRLFHHKDENVHSHEIELGGANALCLKLGYALSQIHRSTIDLKDAALENDYSEQWLEVSMICSALAMIYGCSIECRKKSFSQIGQGELVPLLGQVMESYIRIRSYPRVRIKENGVSMAPFQWNYDEVANAVVRCTQVIRSFAKLEIAKSFLIHFDEGSILARLSDLIVSDKKSSCQKSPELPRKTDKIWLKLKRIVNARVRMEAVCALKDLTFRASDDDKTTIFGQEGIVDAIVSAAATEHDTCEKTEEDNHFESDIDKSREYASAILWNFAINEDLRVKLAQHVDLITVLVKLTTDENSRTRKNAASALGNIATEDEAKKILIKHGNGSLVKALLKVVREDIDDGARRRAMRTLRCVASGNVSLLVTKHDEFIDSIVHASIEDSDRDTRFQATETLATMMLEIEYSPNDDENVSLHSRLIEALIRNIAASKDKKCAETTCRSLSRELSHIESDGHRLKISDCPHLMQALEGVALNDSHSYEAKYSTAKILYTLSTFDENTESMVCNSVLNSLAVIASIAGPSMEKAPVYAVRTIIQLSRVEPNRRYMAEHENLLTALVNFTVTAPDGSLKDEAKRTILQLVPIL